jgi:hypothetical protein
MADLSVLRDRFAQPDAAALVAQQYQQLLDAYRPGGDAAGNINLFNRPVVKNPDGSISTVRSTGVNLDGRETLLPTVSPEGKNLSLDEAIDLYRRTGQHLGKFDTVDQSNAYAQALHEAQAKQYAMPDIGVPAISPGPQVSAGMPWANRAADVASRLVGGQIEGAKRLAETPGAIMTPNPYKPGSEEWHYFEGERDKAITDFGPAMGLNMVLAGTGGTAAGPGEVLFGAGRKPLPPRPPVEDLPPPPIGHNMPPTWAQELPRPKPAKTSTEIPDIRGLPVDQAIEIARTQPHLIKAGEQSEGFYVGGPRNLVSKQDLNRRRAAFDEYVGADPRGGDWYDRYRTYLNEVTGGNPTDIDWASKQHGQWSAGVDPGSEQHFVLKENNAALAGMPTRANYPAQHEAFMRSIEANDPNRMQLGDKTGEYAALVNPIRPETPGATGVNDFRHARNFGYTEPSGAPQKGSLTGAGHSFLDMETALAVDRANRANLGGRSDWTGEQLQAAPWVRQKALDLMSRNKNLSYDEAFPRANRTIADYADRHTAFGTYEPQPGAAGAGHMPRSVDAPMSEREAFAHDPRSSWSDTPFGRDAIYGGMRLGDTGVAMRARPTQEMQGLYQGPAGLETNPGAAARPLVSFDTTAGPFKKITEPDRALLNAAEATRAYVDAQNAGAWHKPWVGGPAKESQSLFFPKSGKSTPAEMLAVQKATSPFGLSDVADTGQGITATRFWPPLADLAKGEKDTLGRALQKAEFKDVVPGSEPRRVRVDSDIVDYSEKWPEGPGSGAATRTLLEHVTKTPEIRAALNNNPQIAQKALDRLQRDQDWASKWGAPREDIQNARRIIAGSSNTADWIDRLEHALKIGAISLPAVAAIVGTAHHLGSAATPGREGS